MRQINWRRSGGAIVALAFSSALLAQPSSMADAADCQVAGGPGGNCCACNYETWECIKVQHGGVQGCSSTFCSTETCDWNVE